MNKNISHCWNNSKIQLQDQKKEAKSISPKQFTLLAWYRQFNKRWLG